MSGTRTGLLSLSALITANTETYHSDVTKPLDQHRVLHSVDKLLIFSRFPRLTSIVWAEHARYKSLSFFCAKSHTNSYLRHSGFDQ